MSFDVHHKRMAYYSGLMEEIKRRHAVIDAAIHGKLEPFVPGVVSEELCYLQLRLICESLALACLLAHGDIEAAASQKLHARWEADRIMKALAKIHPNFYPRPGRQILGPNREVIRVDTITEPYLTRDDLVKLWRDCGIRLHRGSLGDLLGSKPRRLIDFKQIIEPTEKLTKLLSHHQISLVDPTLEYWVLMNPPSGKVEYFLMHRFPV